MKLGIIGFGYVGSAVANGFRTCGHEIHVFDISKEKLVQAKKDGHAVHEHIEELVDNSNIIFVCVPTPPKDDGSCDTSIVENVIEKIAKSTKEEKIVVIKSTVIIGTTDKIINRVSIINDKIKIIFNPEFLRAKYAKQDFLNPDRIVIGGYDKKAIEIVKKLYESFNRPIIIVDPKTAEMIKYTSNAFLATKVSFANQIKMICDKLGIDAKKVMEVVTMDHRINPSHLDPTKGPFGGACLPKDLDALIKKTEEMGIENILLKAVKEINKKMLIDTFEKRLNNNQDKS